MATTKKLRQYYVINGYNRTGASAFVVRIVGNSGASGYVCATWGKSKTEEKEIMRLVEQANQAFERSQAQ
jgi:hypothetical protein